MFENSQNLDYKADILIFEFVSWTKFHFQINSYV